jgi:four helix bundle protein
VPSNIAEGQGRASTGEFKQFLGHARGSLLEVETQLQIACSLEYLKPEYCSLLLRECSKVGRVLNGLLAALPRHRYGAEAQIMDRQLPPKFTDH